MRLACGPAGQKEQRPESSAGHHWQGHQVEKQHEGTAASSSGHAAAVCLHRPPLLRVLSAKGQLGWRRWLAALAGCQGRGDWSARRSLLCKLVTSWCCA